MSEGYVGGSFAPPLSDEILEQYRELVESTDPKSQIGDALRILLNCVTRWWNLPESVGGSSTKDRTGRASVIKLDQNIQDELFDHIPWMEELNVMDKVFEPIQDRSLRNAAYHLLWHAKELCLDREPVTIDKID